MAKTPKDWSDVPEFLNESIKDMNNKIDSIKNPEFKNFGKTKPSDQEDEKEKNDEEE